MKEAKNHITLLQRAFLNRGSLGVNDYYELMEITPIPEKAYHYYWTDVSSFLFRKDNFGYHITALDPFKIEEEENE